MKCSRCPNETTVRVMCEKCLEKSRAYKRQYLKNNPEALDRKREWNKLNMRKRRMNPTFIRNELEYQVKYHKSRGIPMNRRVVEKAIGVNLDQFESDEQELVIDYYRENPEYLLTDDLTNIREILSIE